MLISTVGYIAFIKVNLFLIHKEVKHELMRQKPDDECTILRIPKKEQNLQNAFVAIHSREFRYKGMMYDVISQRDSADITIFKCIRDEDEENVFRVLADIIKLNHAPGRSDKASNFPMLFNFYFIEVAEIALPMLQWYKLDYHNYYNYQLLNNYFPPNTPPPNS